MQPFDGETMSRAKNWCFTLNNYTENEVARLRAGGDEISYLIVGKEIGESGTPHLQGFVQFKNRCRLEGVKSFVGERAHVEAARNIFASVEYCKKENDYFEVGSLSGGAGSRNDLDGFRESVKAGMTDMRELREKHASVCAKYPRFVSDYIRDQVVVNPVANHSLRGWQQGLSDYLATEPDDRKICFVVDYAGNKGKTWFCKWYVQKNRNSQIILPGKVADMAYMIRTDVRVIFMDCPRSKQGEFIQYDFLEHIKNGQVFSSKYEPLLKVFNPVHLVVFMNEQPDRTKLSLDRYSIMTLMDDAPVLNLGNDN